MQAKRELSKENVMEAWCVWLGQGECDMPLGIIKTHLLHHMVSNQTSSPSYICISSLLHFLFIWSPMCL